MIVNCILKIGAVFIFVVGIFSCKENTNTKAEFKLEDSLIKKLESAKSYNVYKRVLNLYKIKKLDDEINIKDELRFTFFSRYGNNYYLFRLNYSDSTLYSSKFWLKSPDGTRKDSILFTNKIQLDYKEISDLHILIANSMLLQLEVKNKHICNNSLDASLHIYELKYTLDSSYRENECLAHYDLTYVSLPRNTDFILLGEYIKFLGNVPNSYKKLKPLKIERNWEPNNNES